MKAERISIKTMFLLMGTGAAASMLTIAALLFAATGEGGVLLAGGALTVCALVWLFLLTLFFAKRLSRFTAGLCRTMDSMISGREPVQAGDSETLFARISYRLVRLYSIMQENRRRVDEERQELQMLVSNISHQVKTPVSNLKMVADTLLLRTVTEQEQRDFLQGIRSQADKLEFLFQALVKTSRLETGLIRLEKKDGPLLDTLAQAMGGIIYGAEEKNISMVVQCPEELRLSHDSRWTAEALFNLLDNAVKYTPAGGRVAVEAVSYQLFCRIDVTDTGPGIPEEELSKVFQRFYRSPAAYEAEGVGIGLYLARQIAQGQGGYIKASSRPGQGSRFSLYLPRG